MLCGCFFIHLLKFCNRAYKCLRIRGVGGFGMFLSIIFVGPETFQLTHQRQDVPPNTKWLLLPF